MSTIPEILPCYPGMSRVIELADRIKVHESRDLSPLDTEYFNDLVVLGGHADTIIGLANTLKSVYELLCALQGHSHFDVGGCESTEAYVTLKDTARHFVETGYIPPQGIEPDGTLRDPDFGRALQRCRALDKAAITPEFLVKAEVQGIGWVTDSSLHLEHALRTGEKLEFIEHVIATKEKMREAGHVFRA
jgi:hypothetical protein